MSNSDISEREGEKAIVYEQNWYQEPLEMQECL